MATKKIVISGGEYGRTSMALDAATGQVLWEAGFTIDKNHIFVESAAGNVFLADTENRCVVVSKDGVILRTGGFVYDLQFAAAVNAQILAMYPDATFGNHADGPLARNAYVGGAVGYGDAWRRTPDSSESSPIHLGGTRFFTRIQSFSFGTDAAGVSISSPSDWQVPFGAIFDYDIETGAYTNMVLIGTPASVQTAISRDNSHASYLTNTASHIYFLYQANGSNPPKILRVTIADGTFESKQISADGGTSPLTMSNWSDQYVYTPRGGTAGHAYIGNLLKSGDSNYGYLHIKSIANFYNRDATIAGVGYIFDDLTDFETATTLAEYIAPSQLSTNFTADMLSNFGSVGPSEFFSNYNKVGQQGDMLYCSQTWSDSVDNQGRAALFSLDLLTGTVAWLDEAVYGMARYVIPTLGETDTNAINLPYVDNTHIYFMTWGGWHRVARGVATVENLYLTSDDDEDWAHHYWVVEWPTFEIPVSVSSPSTVNVLDVILYDEATGQRLRNATVDGEQVVECFTTDHKFIVCKSPDEDTNYKVSAHLVPEATA